AFCSPRPRAMPSPSNSPGPARNSTNFSAWPGLKARPTRLADNTVARIAPPSPPRRRCRVRGNGATEATGRPTTGTTREGNSRADIKAAPSTPLVRGSGRSPVLTPTDTLALPAHRSGLLGGVGKQRDVPRPLDRDRQLALVLGAGAEHAPGQDLAPLRDKGR